MCLLPSELIFVRCCLPLSFTNTVTFSGSYFISWLMTSTIPSLSAHQISVSACYLSPGFCSVAPVRFATTHRCPATLSVFFPVRHLAPSFSIMAVIRKKKKSRNLQRWQHSYKANLACMSYCIVSLCVLASWLTHSRTLRSSGAAGCVCSTIRTRDVSVWHKFI